VPVRDRWCHHVPPATATVACGGEQHRISWRRGKLKIEDHDLAAERTMVAFGGDKPPCLQALQLWRNLHSWAMSGHMLQQMQSRLGPGALLVPGDLQRVHELGLVLTWDRAWRHSRYFSDHGRLLREQLERRAVPAVERHLRQWMPQFGCRRLSGIELKVQRSGQSEGLYGQMDSVGARVTAVLGARWLTRVAARGLELVDTAFVLEVTGEHAGGVGVRAVRWARQPAGWAAPEAAAAVARPTGEGGWSLAWDDGP